MRLRNFILILCSLPLLRGISSCQPFDSSSEVDPSLAGFENYISDFRKAAADVGVGLVIPPMRIEFKPNDVIRETTKIDAALALCLKKAATADQSPQDGEVRQIWVSTEWWAKVEKQYPPEQVAAVREAVIFHELGHCVLNRHHTEVMIQDGRHPGSLMFFKYIPPRIYMKGRTYYLAELFGRINQGQAPTEDLAISSPTQDTPHGDPANPANKSPDTHPTRSVASDDDEVAAPKGDAPETTDSHDHQ
jgi:hypothetical protein